MNSYCLYHRNCGDGFAAAAVIWKKFGWNSWKYIAVGYQEPVPEEIIRDNEIDKIMIVDFSYPKSVLEELEKHCRGLVVIDHHATAPTDYPGIIYDKDHSGCVLVWKYLFSGEPVPMLLEYIEDRDMWWWKLPNSREINLGLEMMERYKYNGLPDFEEYDRINIYDLLGKGKVIQGYKKKLIREICGHAWVGNVLGYEGIPCVDVGAGSLTSEVGEELRNQYSEAPFVLLYGINDNQLIVSLRAGKEEIDLGQLCKQVGGGGGHFAAAGMKRNLNNNELINLINNVQ